MLTPQQLSHCSDDIVKLYSQLDESIVRDIARRICKAGYVTETGKIQINALQDVGMIYNDVINNVSKISGISDDAVKQLFADASITSLDYDMSIYEAAGMKTLPLNMSPAAMQVLEAGFKKTKGNLNNLTKTTAVSAQQTFINACSIAEMQVTSGAFDYNTAIRNAIKLSAKDGFKVTYKNGYQEKLDVAVRRNVMTGLGQTTGEISHQYALDMGCDLMEITAHAGARPSHAMWQGRVVSLSGRRGYLSFADIGYGSGDGFKGWNCRHDWYPFIEGVSKSMYSPADLKKLDEKSINYNEELYTEYEAEQKMRYYERKIRDTRRELAAYDEAIKTAQDEALKADLKQDFTKASVKLKNQEAKLNDFCEQTGLLKDSARIQTHGFGRSTSQKAVWANKKVVDKKIKRGTIKNLDIDDFELMADSSNILPDVLNVISRVIKEFENAGNMYISDVNFGYFIDEASGKTALFQVQPNKYGLIELNINSKILAEKSLQQIDQEIRDTIVNLPKNLTEAIVHECGHAKAYYRKTIQEIIEMNENIKNKGIKGISIIAENDGAECIAEVEVLLYRKSKVPKEAMNLYNQYIKGGKK